MKSITKKLLSLLLTLAMVLTMMPAVVCADDVEGGSSEVEETPKVTELELYKNAWGDSSMLANYWNEGNPLIATTDQTPDDLDAEFKYIAADTNILEGVALNDYKVTWYYSDSYNAEGTGYNSATCTTSAEDFKDNGTGSKVATGTATYSDGKNFKFEISENNYTNWGMHFMDFKTYPLTDVDLGTYYYYVEITYPYGEEEKVLSTKDNQAVVKVCKPYIAKIGTATKTYNGKAQTQTVTVTDTEGNKLVKGTDYDVTYKNNKNVGTATVTVTGKGIYGGDKTANFKINPKGTSLKSLKKGRKSLTATWKKQSTQTTGYEIRYSLKSNMSSPKKITISKNSTVKKTVKKLKAKKKYYVQVRTYKTVNGTRYYSSWSAKKSIKTK